jgi:hypothetical protein
MRDGRFPRRGLHSFPSSHPAVRRKAARTASATSASRPSSARSAPRPSSAASSPPRTRTAPTSTSPTTPPRPTTGATRLPAGVPRRVAARRRQRRLLAGHIRAAPSDVAILGATGRPVLDGEPYQGSLAGFLAEEAGLLRPPRGHLLALRPPRGTLVGATDITTAETRLKEIPARNTGAWKTGLRPPSSPSAHSPWVCSRDDSAHRSMPEIMVYAAEFPFRSVISRCSRWTCVMPADPEAPSRTGSRGNQRGVLLSSDGRAGRPGSSERRRQRRPCG